MCVGTRGRYKRDLYVSTLNPTITFLVTDNTYDDNAYF